MAKYTVKSPIKFDGKSFKPGDSIDLPEKEVAPLQAVGAIEPAGKAPEKGKKD